jgi:uncharacterized protein
MRDERELEHLDERTCRRLVERHHFGRVALNDDGGPVVLPVNYTVVDDTIVFRSGPGTKLTAATERVPVTFQIDDVDEERRLGWSVMVRGHLEEVTDPDERSRLEAEVIESFAPGERAHFLRISTGALSGRRVPLPRSIPAEWFERVDLGNVWYGQDGSDLLG